MKRLLIMILVLATSGCATANLTKMGINFPVAKQGIKTVAVVPIDFKVFQITAGGVSEEYDEYSQKAQDLIKESLERHVNKEGVAIQFYTRSDMKLKDYDNWIAQKGLFQAVAVNVLRHAYPGVNAFPSKIKNFDYTLGEEFADFARPLGADAVLFIQGISSVRTAGKVTMDILEAALLGVNNYYFSVFNIGLVDGKTGNLIWFKTSNGADRDFRNPKQVEQLIQWITQDFLNKT